MKTNSQLNQQQFYQVDMAEVRQVMTQGDINQQNYPNHFQGAIKARLLYTQQGKDLQQLMIILPRDPYFKRIPVVGQIVLCSKHIDFNANIFTQPDLNQYYYFGILNILDQVNNNAVAGLSKLGSDEQFELLDENTCGQKFYIDWSKKNFKLKQGDVLNSGRYGQGLKFTNTLDENNKKMLPKTILMNNTNQLYDKQNDKYLSQNYNNIGSYISLEELSEQPFTLLKLSASRQLLNQINQFTMIGNNIIQNSDRIIVNAKKNDVEIYANQNIILSSNKNILNQSQKIIIDATKQITLRVGDTEINIKNGQIHLIANKIFQDGQSILQNVIDGQTPGYNSIIICPFSGAPHTTAKVNK